MRGLDLMKERMMWAGGPTQDDRNVKAKYKSFLSACRNSYQAEWITFKDKKFRCLIVPDKLTNDYDQKSISIDFNAGMETGDVFYWDRTKSYWIAYLQRYEEEAYYRARIRKCDYSVDVNGKKYWTYLRGPVETALIWKQKHNIEFNKLNYSLLLYVKQDEHTTKFFQRFRKVKFEGHNWQVAVVDRYSQPGLLEVYLDEFYDNPMEDAAVDKEEVAELVKPNPAPIHIEGPQFVNAFQNNVTYSIVGTEPNGEFVLSSKKAKIVKSDGKSCTIDIVSGRSGSFFLEYRVNTPEVGSKPIALIDVKIKSL